MTFAIITPALIAGAFLAVIAELVVRWRGTATISEQPK
jgi:hypothetical protein